VERQRCAGKRPGATEHCLHGRPVKPRTTGQQSTRFNSLNRILGRYFGHTGEGAPIAGAQAKPCTVGRPSDPRDRRGPRASSRSREQRASSKKIGSAFAAQAAKLFCRAGVAFTLGSAYLVAITGNDQTGVGG
jgi:hypothetical protein